MERFKNAMKTAGSAVSGFLHRTILRSTPVTRFFGRGYAAAGRMMEKIRRLEKHPLLFIIGLSFILYLVVEMLSRRSPVAGITYLFSQPVVFLYNWLIVLVTLSVSLLFRRREFVMSLVSLLWFALGIVNCVMLGYRTTPLNAMDFETINDVISIFTVYFSKIEILGMFVLAAFCVGLVAFLFIKTRKDEKSKRRLPLACVSVGVLSVMLFAATTLSVSSGSLATTFHNIQDAYKEYGFAYCFACSVVDRGVSEPDDYSQASVQAILDEINADGGNVSAKVQASDKATTETPNIIILQMESFFDVNHLKNVTYSQNPVPNFDAMKDEFTSGFLTVPSFGAGTANTEFEVNTGMSMDFFGPGEYPYTTIMRQTTDESVAYNLKPYGYSTHAIHDHTARFYGRNWVYPNLGFDTFTSIEYMNNVKRNPLDWADDSVLTGEITKAMNSTPGQDYVFAVSVQGHGKYPTEPIDKSTIKVSGFNESEAVGFEYYVNQLHEMDEFLGELTDRLSQSDEPTVLVVYGDHLPKFSIEASDLDNNNIYQTEYVMWNNFGLRQADQNLTSYQLSAYVLGQVGIHNGVVSQFQQYCKDSDTYYNDLHTLQYDILYGKNYAYGGTHPFQKTDMQFGIDPVTISSIDPVGDAIMITGQNFTDASKIFINGDQVTTSYLSPTKIMCSGAEGMKEGDKIEVIQMSSKKTHLGTTGEWVWSKYGCVPDASYNDETSSPVGVDGTTEANVNSDISDMNSEGR